MAVAPAVFVVFERADKTPIWILLRRRAFFTSRSPFGCNPPCTDSQKSCMGGRERETFLCTFSSPYSHLSLSFFLSCSPSSLLSIFSHFLPLFLYPCFCLFSLSLPLTFLVSMSTPSLQTRLSSSLSFSCSSPHLFLTISSPSLCILSPHSFYSVTSPYFSLSLCLFV